MYKRSSLESHHKESPNFSPSLNNTAKIKSVSGFSTWTSRTLSTRSTIEQSSIALLESNVFQPPDLNLFHCMYDGRFFSAANLIGERLRHKNFIPFDPVNKMVQASGRGCTVTGLEHPAGSIRFSDDTILHTGGPDLMPDMRVLADTISPFSTGYVFQPE